MKYPGLFLRRGIWSLFSIFMFFVFALCIVLIYFELQLPNVSTLKDIHLQVPLRIYTSDGKLIAEYGEVRRIPVQYKAIPKPLIQAILATEDQRFFEHPGVDILGLSRAALELITTGKKSQGGSTITMQVARNFFLHRKKTYTRKFKEILLAIKIDRIFSKEKNLELYLNKIYLGHRAYGVGAAAYVYYGKSLGELNLAQLSMIAGLPRAPSSTNPISNPRKAKKRRNHVLARMLDENYITRQEYEKALAEPVTASYHGPKIQLSAPYVAETIRAKLVDYYGNNAYSEGLQVYSTIDSTLQTAANQAIHDGLIAYDKRHGFRPSKQNLGKPDTESAQKWVAVLKTLPNYNGLFPAAVLSISKRKMTALLANGNVITVDWGSMKWACRSIDNRARGARPRWIGDVVDIGDIITVEKNPKGEWVFTQAPLVEGALVAISPQTGGIKALVGGFNYYRSKFNRVMQAERQPGSSFKPFVYSAALDKGFTLASLINDAPLVFADRTRDKLWRPRNSSRQFNGPTRLRIGLVRSRNLVSIRLLEAIGINYALEYLNRFGFDPASLPPNLSLALGSASITPLELARGYALFANGGYKITPYIIQKIIGPGKKIVMETHPQIVCNDCGEQFLSAEEINDGKQTNIAPQTISSQTSYLMNVVLRDVIQNGTGRGAKVLKRNDIGGKTGTTNEKVDAWFAGFNGDIVTVAWVGFDSPQSLHEYGAQAALPIWIDFMRIALKDRPEHSLAEPEGIISVRINPQTGLRAGPSQTGGIFETFREQFAPGSTNSNDGAYSQPGHSVWENEHLF